MSLRPFVSTPTRLFVALACALAAGTVSADVNPQADVPPPQDTPYPGTIALSVDASDTSQGIFRVHETIPVQAGELTLLYPQWLPGNHSPTGPIDKLAGVKISASGKPLSWTRDKYDVYAFHVGVPQGVSSINIDYQFLSPRARNQGRIVMTSEMLNLQWNAVVLYPAGHYSRQITYAPSLKLPQGWQLGSALETQSKSGDTTT
ncbi:MAG TPA: peptidase M61, partial [Rhodanobacteraceae bacterium]|nr:peptidase M61 [Rhodanobacteraceae bacterium]